MVERDDAFVSRAALDLVTFDGPIGTLDTLAGPGRIFAGIDYGGTRDHCAISGIGRVPSGLNDDPTFAVVLGRRSRADTRCRSSSSMSSTVARTTAHCRLSASGSRRRSRLDARRVSPASTGGRRRSASRYADRRGEAVESASTSPQPPPKPKSVWVDNHPRPWRTKIIGVHTSNPIKLAVFGALRLLIAGDRSSSRLPQRICGESCCCSRSTCRRRVQTGSRRAADSMIFVTPSLSLLDRRRCRTAVCRRCSNAMRTLVRSNRTQSESTCRPCKHPAGEWSRAD